MSDILQQRLGVTRDLIYTLSKLGLAPHRLHYNLEFKNFSKCHFGKYRVDKKEVIVYLFRNKERTKLYDYEDLVSTLIHEVCHHIQHEDPNWVRRRGIMHDKDFWDLYNKYMNKYFKIYNKKGGKRYEESVSKSIRKGVNPNTKIH